MGVDEFVLNPLAACPMELHRKICLHRLSITSNEAEVADDHLQLGLGTFIRMVIKTWKLTRLQMGRCFC